MGDHACLFSGGIPALHIVGGLSLQVPFGGLAGAIFDGHHALTGIFLFISRLQLYSWGLEKGR